MLASERKTTATTTGKSFDTLAYAKRMETVGFTRQQAEAMAEEQSKLIDERLATKTDIELLRIDIDQFRLQTKQDLAETKVEIIRWVLGIVVAQTGLILGVLKFHG